MKIRLFVMLMCVSLGILNIQLSFSEDYFTVPSCYVGVFEQDHVECSTKDNPPCPEPSFEKNGYCVVKKVDICKSGDILQDGSCIEKNEYFKVDPLFSKQSLQTGETFGNVPNTFGWFVLTMSLFIVIAYVVMKIKKRNKENEN